MSSELISTAGDLTGRELGDYQVLRRLGSGGMAEVYLAEQRSLGRRVALKVLQPALARDASYVLRFQNEARAVAALVHANIVQIYEVGQADGVHFIAQEYVAGKNLGELLKRQPALAPRLVLDILRQVAAALCKAAEAGIVHRDLKPDNILLSHAGEVKVADFGLARMESVEAKTLTQAGVAMGTPLYMSPEQIEGRLVDVRSDIYSLGVTCYHLLAGAPPHQGETALAVALQHLNTPPQPLENVCGGLPEGLARVVHRMMAKRPEQRYQSPQELIADLRALAAQAAAEGWGEGPEGWSLAEWIAATDTRSRAVAELSQLMQQSSQRDGSRLRLSAKTAIILAALALGAFSGFVFRPRPFLADAPAAPVERRDNVWAQLYHANTAPSEAAWRAVQENFPDEDAYVYALADAGLARYYLFLEQDFRQALAPLRELAGSSEAADPAAPLRAFAYAGLTIAEQRLGRAEQAREAASHLTPEMRDALRRSEPRVFEMLQPALRELGE
jgi:eukaryotic-like serine/threonine-protein kinase